MLLQLVMAALASPGPGLAENQCPVDVPPRLDATPRPTSLALSPTAPIAAVGCADGTLAIVDVATCTTLKRFQLSGGSIARLAWSASGTRIAAALFTRAGRMADALCESFDSLADWVVLDVASGRVLLDERSSVSGHDDPGCAWSADGKLLATWGCETWASVWDLDAGGILSELAIEKQTRITCAAWSLDGRTLFTGDEAGQIRAWDAHAGTIVRTYTWAADRVECLRVSTDGAHLFGGGTPLAVGAWSTRDLHLEWSKRQTGDWLSEDSVAFVDVDSAGEQLISATNPWGTIERWSARAGSASWTHDFHGGNHARLYAVFDPKGEHVAAWGLGLARTARILDASSGAIERDLESIGIEGGLGSLGWTADGRFLVARSARIVVLDGEALAPLGEWPPAESHLESGSSKGH